VIALPGASALTPFRWPRLWMGLWWCAIALGALGSLLPARLLPLVPEDGDQPDALLGYGLLAAIAVQLFATRAALLRAAVGLVLLGVVLELAQGFLTSTRSMDPMDALANTAGVVLGMATAWTPVRDWLLRVERR